MRHHPSMPKPLLGLFGCRPSRCGNRSSAHPDAACSHNVVRSWAFGALVALVACLTVPAGSAREIHVATNGNDTAPGTAEQPLRTVSAAAQRAEPGDVVTVHPGTYREQVKPARGGTAERQRIVYRAAPKQKAVIKGSERITSWTGLGDGIWKVELSNSFFGDYNPYALTVSGGWLNYGQWHHRGDVYLDEEAFLEQRTFDEVRSRPQSWSCAVQENTTTIWANFGNADPNRRLVEINVRESLFMPEVSGLSYITIDGFEFRHAAANWAPPVIPLQTGAIGPRLGKRWLIQNCTIVNARCVGIILGQAPGVNYDDIDGYGDHIIRNNVIRRCGQAGIAGQKGATRSLVLGNLIEETNYRREFGGWETAAIKFHNTVDTVISNNLIRGVYRQEQGAFGIWMDFGNQGTRITGNVICDTEAEAVFLEMNHGPILIDNNVLLGGGVKANSENMVFAHNLFVDCPYRDEPDLARQSQFFTPHTTRVVGHKPGVPANIQWYNNLFVGRGLDDVKSGPGYRADFNAFLQSARPSSFGDTQSMVDLFGIAFRREDSASGITLSFQMSEAPFRVQAPLVGPELVGTFPPVGQTLEDAKGYPITVTTDRSGRTFERRWPGPSAALQRGENRVTWRTSAAGTDQNRYLNAILPPGLRGYAGIEVPSEENIDLLSDGAGEYVEFRLVPGQARKNNGIRAEMSVNYPYQVGDVVRYQWKMRLPEDFKADEPRNRWWVMGQWHDQPDPAKGETWAGFPGRSPPVSFNYLRKDGKDLLSLLVGSPRMQSAGVLPIRRGVWHALEVVIKWSQSADGKVAVFLDASKEPVLAATGPNMHNGYQHYLKLGMYRHPDIATENRLEIRDVSIERLDVWPQSATATSPANPP